ncbi:hypothetical protein QE370_002906 [Aeromicrobium sp. SORGH_AS981]|uniref:helicase-related protein n=1 Tax=Aeromicrobium sp. SORGH_AS_0981 TaxID=3041802 RepID=UPI002855CB88|nr:helicase-related protein [Aeromicrobium sp. SORGH_AS_0981]MDR6119722.1 hypothetical protein [Aeromicrobium sp. SORGH_AS_0981]
MSSLDPWYHLRQLVVDALSDDLIGSPDEETLEEEPLDRFVMGILYPRSSDDLDDVPDLPESAAGASSDAVVDPAVAQSHRQYPSSMGMSFAVVPAETAELVVRARAARFVETDDGWRREQPELAEVRVTTDDVRRSRHPLAEGLELQVVVRAPVAGVSSITAALVSTVEAPEKGRRDAYCWFQVGIDVDAVGGHFVDRNATRIHSGDDESASYALLYRDARDLATGHGCAVTWDAGSDVTALRTTSIPDFALPLADSAGGRADAPLSMADLANGSGLDRLDVMVDDYESWIGSRRDVVPDLDLALQETARKHLAEAEKAAARMRRGLTLVRESDDVGEAFRLMNSAMTLQRYRQVLIRDGKRAAEAAQQEWRPFQMAFILMNLEDVSDPSSKGRDQADLLWFPTGGGKTEAYLGLIAFSIFLRRLRDPHDGGVSVLMRYTLRLLTIQQFERAAGLICAMESLRREKLPTAEPISLGLWVGQGATPNKAKDAKKALKLISAGEFSDVGNPRQLVRCPACGSDLLPHDYSVVAGPDRLVVRCPGRDCDFADGLPVHLIDEDVYRYTPSLVIGTVDKFAMMAWRAETRNLFGGLTGSPPDLIVQDELHLISGPLGTMVGLYETAVDAACSRQGSRPKVLASTATIRRAKDQVRAVFDRDSAQFPPSGIDANDSFFAVEAPPALKGDRLYVGVMAPGVSHTTLMVRVYGALLDAGKNLPAAEKVRDAYWTLLGYFNSLRVLGGAFMQVQDDVPDRLKVIATRLGHEPRELDDDTLELTSRIDSTKVPDALDRLAKGLPEAETADVVLATNMISVGVDVDRLGLMAVMGQPQATAEYIQATSRVGRRYPGLVVVIYNSARSRDISHYEMFRSYHQALYRQVEATGATPFAARARDRGLHGMFVSLVRQAILGANDEKKARDIDAWGAELEGVIRTIVARASTVTNGDAETVEKVEQHLRDLVSSWKAASAVGAVDHYAGWNTATKPNALLQDTSDVVDDEEFDYPVDSPPWPTMTSLRDVDATSHLYVVRSRFQSPKGVGSV